MTPEMKVNCNFKWNNHRKIPLIWIMLSDDWKYQRPLISILINKLMEYLLYKSNSEPSARACMHDCRPCIRTAICKIRWYSIICSLKI